MVVSFRLLLLISRLVTGWQVQSGTIGREVGMPLKAWLMLFYLLLEGWSDEKICNELGMSAGELVRVKYISGVRQIV